MRYNLNFWPPIDWRRESSIDPRFLAVVGFCVLVLCILALWSYNYTVLQAARSELLRNTSENKRVKEAAAEVQRQVDCIRQWEKLEAALLRKQVARLAWSNILALLQTEIPDNVVLQGVAVSSESVQRDPQDMAAQAKAGSAAAGRPASSRSKGKQVKMLQCRLTLSAVALGENAEDTISQFSRIRQKQKSEFAALLDTAELTSVEPEIKLYGKVPAKKFTIVCRLKPVDWYDESTPQVK